MLRTWMRRPDILLDQQLQTTPARTCGSKCRVLLSSMRSGILQTVDQGPSCGARILHEASSLELTSRLMLHRDATIITESTTFGRKPWEGSFVRNHQEAVPGALYSLSEPITSCIRTPLILWHESRPDIQSA
jgi:hypothetical protein